MYAALKTVSLGLFLLALMLLPFGALQAGRGDHGGSGGHGKSGHHGGSGHHSGKSMNHSGHHSGHSSHHSGHHSGHHGGYHNKHWNHGYGSGGVGVYPAGYYNTGSNSYYYDDSGYPYHYQNGVKVYINR